MPLQPFSFPFPQTRFFKAGSCLYKFKIRGGGSYSEMDATGAPWQHLEQEMEDIIRTVLGNLESLQPFSSTHFHVHPYKKAWEGVSQVMCKHSDRELKAYPFTMILYLEKNVLRDTVTEGAKVSGEEEQPVCAKRLRTESPVEDAILQEMVKDMEAESSASVVRAGTELLLPDCEEDSQPEDKTVTVDAVTEDEVAEEEETKTPVQPRMLSSLARRKRSDSEADWLRTAGKSRDGAASGTSPLPGHLFPFSLFFRDT